MDKKELWDTMRLPIDRNCTTCGNKLLGGTCIKSPLNDRGYPDNSKNPCRWSDKNHQIATHWKPKKDV